LQRFHRPSRARRVPLGSINPLDRSGLILLLGHAWGLDVFAAAIIVVLVGGAPMAWLPLVNITT
jgi:hypothetical protein